jgi:hypothetical protein
MKQRFTTSITDKDMENLLIRQFNRYHRREGINDFVREMIDEMRIQGDVSYDFVRSRDGLIKRGSRRIPILVEAGGKRFVIKEYDFKVKDPEAIEEQTKREKEILSRVNGRIAPRVLHFGSLSIAYAEEYVDHNEFWDLNSVLLKKIEQKKQRSGRAYAREVKEAVTDAAYMMAFLARLRINYDHHHFLDEFHVGDSRKMITDFGSSSLFRDDYGIEDLGELGRELVSGNKMSAAAIKRLYQIENEQERMGVVSTIRKPSAALYRRAEYVLRKETKIKPLTLAKELFEIYIEQFVEAYLANDFPHSISHPEVRT